MIYVLETAMNVSSGYQSFFITISFVVFYSQMEYSLANFVNEHHYSNQDMMIC